MSQLQTIEYNPITGDLYRSGIKVEAKPNAAGYLRIAIDGKRLYQHRVAYRLMTGEWPIEVDHANGVRHHNQWINLTNGNHTDNMQNVQNAKAGSAVGVLGVTWDKRAKKYLAQITRNGVNVYLGRHATVQQASAAYWAAR